MGVSGVLPQFAPQLVDELQLLSGGVTMVDDGIHGWNVPEIREAVFWWSEERAELVMADAMERARRIADLLRTRYSAPAITLYGSLAEGCILVEGFRGDYWEMYVMADEIADPLSMRGKEGSAFQTRGLPGDSGPNSQGTRES